MLELRDRRAAGIDLQGFCELPLSFIEALLVNGAFGANAHVAQLLVPLALFQQLSEFELLAVRRSVLGIDTQNAVAQLISSGRILALDRSIDFGEALSHVL